MFHVGQLVVCVDDEINAVDFPVTLPVRGVVYTIRRVKNHCGDLAVLVHEIVSPAPVVGEYGYLASRFRPVVDSHLDVFREMLVRPPTERVDA